MESHHLLRKLKGSMVVSNDDFNVGEIKDFFFDDERWTVRYFVVNTGSWLNERLVLISPYAITEIEWGGFNVRVNLSKEQIQNSPTPEDNKPVSRLYEEKYSRYYQIPYYWMAGDGLWPNNIYPGMYAASPHEAKDENIEDLNEQIAANHLRSYEEILHYHIHARDDVFGHVEDLVMHEETYAVEYLVIDTRNFFPSPSVLIPVEWISTIDWEESEIRIDLPKDKILEAQRLDPDKPIDLNLA